MNVLSPEFVESYKDKKAPWGFNGLGYVVYKRTYARQVEGENRLEEWHETIARCIEGAQEIGAGYTTEEAERLFDYIFNLKGSFSGRALWQLGTPLIEKIGGPSLVNCWVTSISSIEDFEFLMDHLMLGGGVGFSIERSLIHELPKIKSGVNITHEKTNDADIIVPDKREGWSRLLHAVLKSYFYTGKSFTYSTILLRGYGAPLKTFGGTASGPEILVEGISDICSVLNNRVGKKLRSIDVLDICNIIGRIVIAGSARRSAQLASGDPDDFLYLRAKNWSTGKIPAWRANSNNSIYADSSDEIVDEFWKGYTGNSEPYGLLNRKLARTCGRLGEPVNDSLILGSNPCSEIFLENGEPCNLSEIFLPNVSSYDELIDLSMLLYKTQKAITTLRYPYAKSMETIRKNRRLGLGVTGWLQSSEEQISWLDDCYLSLKKFDQEWSAQLGISPSIKLTTVKPSGTLSILAGITPGIHPGYSQYHIRRVRFGSNDPLVDLCRKAGHHVQWDVGLDGREDHTRLVVDFPCSFPEKTILARDVSAIDQLEWVKRAQTIWSDNAVSVTVYYRPDEIPGIQQWLEENYDSSIKSVSFLLHTDHNFPLPPYEEITEAQYKMLTKKLNPDMLMNVNIGEGLLSDLECEGGACPIK